MIEDVIAANTAAILELARTMREIHSSGGIPDHPAHVPPHAEKLEPPKAARAAKPAPAAPAAPAPAEPVPDQQDVTAAIVKATAFVTPDQIRELLGKLGVLKSVQLAPEQRARFMHALDALVGAARG